MNTMRLVLESCGVVSPFKLTSDCPRDAITTKNDEIAIMFKDAINLIENEVMHLEIKISRKYECIVGDALKEIFINSSVVEEKKSVLLLIALIAGSYQFKIYTHNTCIKYNSSSVNILMGFTLAVLAWVCYRIAFSAMKIKLNSINSDHKNLKNLSIRIVDLKNLQGIQLFKKNQVCNSDITNIITNFFYILMKQDIKLEIKD